MLITRCFGACDPPADPIAPEHLLLAKSRVAGSGGLGSVLGLVCAREMDTALTEGVCSEQRGAGMGAGVCAGHRGVSGTGGRDHGIIKS